MSTNKPQKHISEIYMLGMALVIGMLGDFGALFLRTFIVFIHNLFFLGKFSLIYDVTKHTPSVHLG